MKFTRETWISLVVLIALLSAGSLAIRLIAHVLGVDHIIDLWASWMITGLVLYPFWARYHRKRGPAAAQYFLATAPTPLRAGDRVQLIAESWYLREFRGAVPGTCGTIIGDFGGISADAHISNCMVRWDTHSGDPVRCSFDEFQRIALADFATPPLATPAS